LKSLFATFLILGVCFLSCKKNDSYKKNEVFKFEKLQGLDKGNKLRILDSLNNNIQTKDRDSSALNLLLDLSTEYYYLNERKKSLQVTLQALEIANKINDSLKVAKSYYYIGNSYENNLKDSAYYYYLKAEKLYFNLQQIEKVARMQFNKGYILFFEGNYTECEVELIKALNNLKESKNSELKYYVLNLLGICQEKLEDYEAALKYHELALKEVEKLKRKNSDDRKISTYYFSTIINICNIYDSKNEYEKSIFTLNKLILEIPKDKFPREHFKAINNLAYSKMKLGDLKNVESLLQSSLDFAEKENNKTEILYTKLNLGEFYLINKDTAKAIEYLNESFTAASTLESNKEILRALKLLAIADKKNSSVYKGKYIIISDELAKKQLTNRNKYARIEYETTRIENENKILSEKNLRLITGGTILSFLTIIFFFYRHNLAQKREYILVKLKKEAEEQMFNLVNKQHLKVTQARENEQNRIAKELHDNIMNKIYAIRLQLGILNQKTDDESCQKRMQNIEELQILELEIRQISHNLKVDELHKKIGFYELLVELIQTENRIGKTKFELKTDTQINWNGIPTLLKVNLYRILQETLTNVVKYAQAQNCIITITKEVNGIQITIHDNGIGFNVNETKKGIGMKNIFERVKELDGKIELKSDKKSGTQYKISLKIQSK
jgi:signal transduction histidine kinase